MIGSYIMCCTYGRDEKVTIDIVMKDSEHLNGDDYDAFDHECSRNKKSKSRMTSTGSTGMTFWSFVKSQWSQKDMDMDEKSDVSVSYASTSDFLYRQKSGYADNIGLKSFKSKTPTSTDHAESRKGSVS